MPERIYNGPHAEVDVGPLPDGNVKTVLRGESIDVDSAVAKNLDEQGTWLTPGKAEKTDIPPAKVPVDSPTNTKES